MFVQGWVHADLCNSYSGVGTIKYELFITSRIRATFIWVSQMSWQFEVSHINTAFRSLLLISISALHTSSSAYLRICYLNPEYLSNMQIQTILVSALALMVSNVLAAPSPSQAPTVKRQGPPCWTSCSKEQFSCPAPFASYPIYLICSNSIIHGFC